MANVEHNNDAVRPVHDGGAGQAGDANAVSRMQAEVQQVRGSAAASGKLNDGGTSGSDSPGAGSLPKLDLYDGAGGGGGKNRCFEPGGDGASAPNGSSASGRAGSESTGNAAGGPGVGAENPTRHYRHR